MNGALIKKIHENGLLLEDIILLGASIFSGGICSQAFGSLCDLYPIASIGAPLGLPPEHFNFDANDLAEWIDDSGFDGYLCLIHVPTGQPDCWHELFFYGDSIDACVDQAIERTGKA